MSLAGEKLNTIRVKVCVSDPISSFGLVSRIRQSAGLTLVAPVKEEEADVIVVTLAEANEQGLNTLRGLPDAVSKGILLIVDGCWTADLHAAIELGVRGVLFRNDFNWHRFNAAICAISQGEGAFPTELQGRLLDQVERTTKEVLAPRGLSPSGLTLREIDILRLVAEGNDLEDIAVKLQYSERTVKNVLYGLMKRLNLRNRAHAVSFAIRSGVI